MKRKNLKYWVLFYFWSLLYFLEGLYSMMTKPKQEIEAFAPQVNILEDEPAVLSEKPSQIDAMANKAMLGYSAIPKNKKNKIVIGIILIVWFIVFGIINTFYWLGFLIKKHPIVRHVLLSGIIAWIVYLIFEYLYLYFKDKKHKAVLLLIKNTWYSFTSDIKVIWSEATVKAEKKLQNI